MGRLDSVDIAIMPGGAGDVGDAVIRAILSYAGTTIESYEREHETRSRDGAAYGV